MLVDVHAHLHFPQFEDDVAKVVERARAKGIVSIINSGTDYEGNVKTLELAKKYDIVKASLGVYPRELESRDLEKEFEFIEKHKKEVIAIGEAGMDFKEVVEEDEKKKQREVFLRVIKLAEKLKKPLVVHSRKAEADVMEMLESSNLKKIVMHCFSGNFKLVKRCADNGWRMSIPSTILRSSHFQGIVGIVPMTQLLTETDAPYLCPPGEQRNEPAFVGMTVEKIAELKNLDAEETAKIIYINYKKIMG